MITAAIAYLILFIGFFMLVGYCVGSLFPTKKK
jgi:hypothetical protein